MNAAFAAIRARAQFIVPWSLRRKARRLYRRLNQGGLVAIRIRVIAERWALIPPLVQASVLPLAVVVIAIGGLFLPCPVYWSALSQAKDATTFVAQAWTVTSVSVGFAVVLIVFAFQTVATTRPTTNIRDLAAVTPLLLVLYLSVASLLIDGLVLLQVGYQAPAKWAASWATDISGLTIFMLAFLIGSSLRSIDPQVIQRRRIAKVQKRAIRTISVQAIQMIALNLLIRDGKEFAYSFSQLESVGSLRDSLESIRSTGQGILIDIRLDRLRRVAKKAVAANLSKPVITVIPGRAVAREKRLAILPKQLDDRSRRLMRAAFKIRDTSSDQPSLLVAAADELHEEAMQAINSGRTSAFQETCQAQEELLVAFPEAWARLGQSFTADLAAGISPLELGPLDPVGVHLYSQAVDAARHDNTEIASRAAGVPVGVAIRALDLNAHGLSDRMLLVLSGIATATGGSQPKSVAHQVHGEVLGLMTSYIELFVFPRIEDRERPESARREAIQFLLESSRALADMMKDAVEREDLDFFDEAARKWNDFGRFWFMNHQYLRTGQDLEYELAHAARNILDRFRLALCAWQIRRLWTDVRDEAALRAFASLSSFQDVQYLFDIAEIAYDDPISGLLTRWTLNAAPPGVMQTFDTSLWALRSLVLISLRLVPSAGLRLRPTQWILDNAGRLDTTITEVEAAGPLIAAIGIVNITVSTAALRTSVQEAVAQQEKVREEELIKATIADTRKEVFTSNVREAWQRCRAAANLMTWAASFEEVEGEHPVARHGHSLYAPKEWFVNERIAGLENFARQLGTGVPVQENEGLLKAIARADPLRRTSGDINERLDKAIAYMRQKGYQPQAIFVPWRAGLVPVEFACQPLDRQSSSAGPPPQLLGLFKDLRVLEAPDLPGDRVILVDLAALARFRQWNHDGQALQVKVTSLDEQSARAAVRADRKLMRAPGCTGLADRARALLKQVVVEVWEESALEFKDPGAARSVFVPPSLRQL